MLNNLPTLVSEPGEYLLRNGLTAFVDKISPPPEPGTTAFQVKGDIYYPNKRKGRYTYMIWHVSGRAYPLHESPLDIISQVKK